MLDGSRSGDDAGKALLVAPRALPPNCRSLGFEVTAG